MKLVIAGCALIAAGFGTGYALHHPVASQSSVQACWSTVIDRHPDYTNGVVKQLCG